MTIETNLEQFTDDLANEYHFNGTLLVGKQGKAIIKKAYGFANFEHHIPNTLQSKFVIASITKTFTGTAIMMLEERGLLKVTDPISKYIADYPNRDMITIHHLLTHTSGIYSLNKAEAKSFMRLYMTPEEIVEKTFKHKPLQFQPGEKYSYSNSGYIILAHLIEKLTGQSYEHFLTENIFKPLGMSNSGCDDHTKILEHRASGYEYVDKQLRNGEFLDISFRIGCGNLYSTVEDLFLWDQALYSNKIVSRFSLDKMLTSYSEGEYGYGWEVENKHNTIRVGHGGASIGFFTEFSRYVEKEIVIIVLSNITLTPTTKIADRIAGLFNS